MSVRGFTRAGHFPTLIAALLYFDVSCGTWVMLGPLAPFLRDDLGLSSTQQGLLTAIPLLGGVRQAGVYSYRSALSGADEERAA